VFWILNRFVTECSTTETDRTRGSSDITEFDVFPLTQQMLDGE